MGSESPVMDACRGKNYKVNGFDLLEESIQGNQLLNYKKEAKHDKDDPE